MCTCKHAYMFLKTHLVAMLRFFTWNWHDHGFAPFVDTKSWHCIHTISISMILQLTMLKFSSDALEHNSVHQYALVGFHLVFKSSNANINHHQSKHYPKRYNRIARGCDLWTCLATSRKGFTYIESFTTLLYA